MFTWIIGIAIAAWIGAMGIGALMRTASAQAWFGDMLKQSPNLMKIQGIGFAFIALIILVNLIFPAVVAAQTVKWALVGVIASQLSTLFMQLRGGVSRKAMLGPIVLLMLTAVFWSILE